MRISPNNSMLINPAIARQTGLGKTGAAALGSAAKLAEPKFDTVTIATEDSFQKQLQSKISQEIRTARTTGTLNSLREQVQNGEYKIDTQNIARRLMFVWEV